MAVVSAGPYANLHLAQTDNHATPHQSVFLEAGCPSRCPTNSVNGLKANQSTENVIQKQFAANLLSTSRTNP